jgi:predicted nucleic acid-binding protein
MTVDCFLDTNILIYAALGKGTEEAKRQVASELISSANFGLSAQVMQEFYAVATRKTARPLKPAQALEWIELLEVFPCVPVDVSLIKRGAEISVRYRISAFDGSILAAAELLGAKTLFSEDLNHGQSYGAVRVCNPFKAPPPPGFHDDGSAFERRSGPSH